MLPRPCIDCGALAAGSRCPPHATAHKARRNAEAPRARAAVADHVARHGWVCPGDGHHTTHPCTDLTADHVVPISRGGAGGALSVVCRSANSSKGNRVR